MSDLCSEDTLKALVDDMQAGTPPAEQLERVDALLLAFPEDPRLLFLRGSILAGLARLIEAHQALSRAVALAPDFAIARFQLGFFQLTSGEADAALETWGRLDRLPDEHYLRKFVDGLRCLIRDDFVGAIASLRAGIAVNNENLPLNHDMQLIIDRCAELTSGSTAANDDASISETSLILRQFRTPSADNDPEQDR